MLAEVRAHLTPRGVTALFGGGIALTDGLIHQQDIRRPLGIPRDVPAERLVPALDFALRAPALPSRRHVRDLRLTATDLDWTHGDGPEITGPAEALLMAIAGRPAALADLAGAGVPVLAERLQAP
ncbi:MAG TPA: maleylpyruvate isomerase family mycothiol-dependent enzyme, partial [Nakamurella sp.]|nr:maleylpyruvate isomerase family mycothiol-dependent enzyme [Nakamurella sp.]